MRRNPLHVRIWHLLPWLDFRSTPSFISHGSIPSRHWPPSHLCSIRDVIPALAEVRRVLRHDGNYLFLEHGCSNDRGVARRQKLLSPVVKTIGAGCQMNRHIDDLISHSGLQITTLDRFLMPETPRILGEMYRGVARLGVGDK